METVIYQNGIRYSEKKYNLESDFEQLVVENSKIFFGENTILVDAKKKIGIVAMLNEDKIREKIKKHEITTLSEGVQNFYNGPCARIEIKNNKNLDEIIDLLVDIQK